MGSEVIFLSDALKAPDVAGFSIHHVRKRILPRSKPVQRTATKSRKLAKKRK